VITIQATVEVVPGREEHFEALWRQAHPQRNREPGHGTIRLLRDADQRGRSIVQYEWESREHFEARVRTSGMLWLLEATDSWVMPPDWSYLEEIEAAGVSPS
jgi:quinol monooxygenase YgiN